jgi:hypothetical protein
MKSMSTHAPNPKHELYFGLFCFLMMFLLVIWLCTSCSGTRNAQKSSSESSLVDKSTSSEVAKSTETKVTTTKKYIDTIVETKPDSIKGSKPLNEILSGKGFYLESEGSTAKVTYDESTGNLNMDLTTKGRKHDVKINEETKVEEARADTSSKTTANDIKKEEKESQKVVNTKFNSVYLIMGGCVLLVLLFMFVWKRTKLLNRFIGK